LRIGQRSDVIREDGDGGDGGLGDILKEVGDEDGDGDGRWKRVRV
jgi:hypothetical protein